MRSLSALLAGLLLAGCGEVSERLRVVFPDASMRAATEQLAVTAFEPILDEPGADPQFITCDGVGVFAPVSRLSPVNLAAQPGLGRVFLEREPLEFADGLDERVGFPRPEPSPRNPWGAVLVLVEARGEAVAPGAGAGERPATLGSGCYCVRTGSGSHPDPQLDAEVKRACAPLDRESGNERTVPLVPAAPRGFRLEACDTTQVTGPVGASLEPGPAACVRTTTCQASPGAPDCFECDGSCPELEELGEVPVLFEVEGGGIGPTPQIVLTDARGSARAQLDLSGCTGDFEVSARILGRDAETVRFRGSCVEPVGPFACRGEVELGAPAAGLAVLPSPGGGPDRVAVVQERGADDTAVRVVDLSTGQALTEIVLPGEAPEAALGYTYEVDGGQPLLAVATSREVGRPRPALWVRVYAWDGVALTQTATLTEPCGKWTCGSLSSCAGGCEGREQCLAEDGVCVLQGEGAGGCGPLDPIACACAIEVDFGAKVTLTAPDADGDGRADLFATSSGSVPVTGWYSSQATAGALYSAQGCRCGTFGSPPNDIEVASVGGAGETPQPRLPDLWVATSGGSYVVYGRATEGVSALQCGRAKLVGEIIAARDIASGRFACRPELDPSCAPFEDVVVAAAPEGATGGFGGSGFVRVIFGDDRDLSTYDDLFATAETHARLTPRNGRGAETGGPDRVVVGDLNGDGHDDAVVLFGTAQRVRSWVGRSNRGLGETIEPVDLASCSNSRVPNSECRPLDALGLPDVDGDGRAELVVLCEPSNASARLRWFSSSPG